MTLVGLEQRDGVAELRLARPEARNAIDLALVSDLLAAVRALGTPRAVVISAAGEHFSVGGDLRHLAGVEDLGAELARMVPPLHEALALLDELPCPVLTAVQGVGAGGALGLAWVADTVLLAPDTRLVHGFEKIALSGDGGGTFWLPRLVGLSRARQFMAGRGLDAQTALNWGLATDVCADPRAAALARAAALTPADGARRALIRPAGFRAHLERETAAQLAAGARPDAAAAIAAFAAR